MLPEIRIQRALVLPRPIAHQQIHTFCDASGDAYAACAYLRTEYGDRSISSCLIMSKMKVAPINMTSILRLELMAAVLAADLIAKINERLDETYEMIYYWTDSRKVLTWLKNDRRDFKVFVHTPINYTNLQTETIGGGYSLMTTLWICYLGESPRQP